MAQRPNTPEHFVGVIAKRGRFRVVEALFDPGPQLPLAGTDAAVGAMVLVEAGPARNEVVRELGSPKRAADVVGAMIWDAGLRRGFGEGVERDAERAAATADHSGERRDLRALDTFTVDPASARDFDDAVSAQPDGDGMRLWIHIADVAAHVRPGSALEAEAYRRSTSVYVPGTVEPMLPTALSGDACSLVPAADRLAVTMEVHLAASGEPRDPLFYRSVIRSDARLDYDQLDRVFAGSETPPEVAADPLAHARRAASLLADRRRQASLVVESAEPEFEFGPDGEVTQAHALAQTEAHRLIEHLMILTNEQVAQLLEARRIPALYRVHEPPDPDRVKLLFDQLAALDVPTPPLPRNLQRSEAGELVAEASRLVAREAERRGHGRAAYTSLILRSLKQAVYSHRNVGHAGLGSTAYAHFTSPIRRYPDLVAHRALLSALGAGEEQPTRSHVEEAGVYSSEREREAMGIERRADRVCAAFLLERELYSRGWDTRFEGEISGLVGGGAFVRFAGELADIYEGFLPARLLQGDYYDLNETETALVGRRQGHVVRLGDPVTVSASGIETARGRVDLEPAVERPPSPERPRKRPKTRRPRETRRKAQGSREGRGGRRRRR